MNHMSELEEANCRVIFVSFCDPSRPLHRVWIDSWCRDNIEETSAILLLDPTKSAYEAYSIPSSNIAAWGPANLWYYAKAFLCCRHRSVAIRGEAGQLGADFVVGTDGTVLLKHYCRNPTDRVAVSKIVHVVSSHHAKSK